MFIEFIRSIKKKTKALITVVVVCRSEGDYFLIVILVMITGRLSWWLECGQRRKTSEQSMQRITWPHGKNKQFLGFLHTHFPSPNSSAFAIGLCSVQGTLHDKHATMNRLPWLPSMQLGHMVRCPHPTVTTVADFSRQHTQPGSSQGVGLLGPSGTWSRTGSAVSGGRGTWLGTSELRLSPFPFVFAFR